MSSTGMSLFFLALTSLASTKENSKLVSSKYYSDFLSYETSFQIGTPLTTSYYLIDITAPCTWMVRYMWKSHKSSTKAGIQLGVDFAIGPFAMKGIETEDTVALEIKGDKTIQSFPFFVVEDLGGFIPTRVSGIGFAFRFNDTKYSFAHQMKKSNHSDHLSFSIVRNSDDDGWLHLGGIPDRATVNKTHSYCNVQGKGSAWDCKLNEVRIRNSSFVNQFDMHFDSVNSIILVPKAFIAFLLDNYFNEGLQAGECHLLQIAKERRQVKCCLSYIKKLPNLTLVIDQFAYEFSPYRLFECRLDECFYQLALNSNKEEFVFGKVFLRQFDLLFDYEREQVHFYTNDIAVTHQVVNERDEGYAVSKHNSAQNLLMLLMGLVLIAGLVIIFAIRKGLTK